MISISLVLIYLAVVKEYEPVLLLPIGFGCMLANIPLAGMSATEGMMGVLYKAGIESELFPLLIFIGVGAMIDFSPLLAQPRMVLLGAAGQFGIFGTLILAIILGFPLNQAASIGVIGAIDGPTSIFVATKLAPELLAPDRCGRIFIHEPDPHHPAAIDEIIDHEKRALDKNGIRAKAHFAKNPGGLPDRADPCCGPARA
jgi:Na+-transporting methylmalonyl-CoA/oxaloacetate decarboxylase beta subunit